MKNQMKNHIKNILIVLFITFPVAASANEPIMLHTYGVVQSKDCLETLIQPWMAHMCIAGRFVDFPDQIDPKAMLSCGTITGGTSMWSVVSLPLKNATEFSPGDFSEKDKSFLCKNIVIAHYFPDGDFKMFKRESSLILVSSDFQESRWEEVGLEQAWKELSEKFTVGICVNYPEDKLYPTLPPEMENEGSFIKWVRNERKETAAEPVKYDVASRCYGLVFSGDNIEAMCETVAAENTEKAEGYKKRKDDARPFGVGGFYDAESPFYSGWRIFSGQNYLSNTHFGVIGGQSVHPEKVENSTEFSFRVKAGKVDKQDRETHNICDRGWVYFAYPILPQYDHEKLDLPPHDELEAANRDLCEKVSDILENFRDYWATLEKDKPVDFAATYDMESEIIFVGCVYPTSESSIDIELFTKLRDLKFLELYEKHQAKHAENKDEKPFDVDLDITPNIDSWNEVGFSKIRIFSPSKNDSGIWVIMAQSPGFVAFGVPDAVIHDEDEQAATDLIVAKLKERISISQLLAEEKQPPPNVLFGILNNDSRFDVRIEYGDKSMRVALKCATDSFGAVCNTALAYCGEYLQLFLPTIP